MDEVIYVPESKESFFDFDFDKIEIKNYKITSAFLSHFFVVKGKKILKVSYYLLIFPTFFTIAFVLDTTWIVLKFLTINLYKFLKFLFEKSFDFLIEIFKNIFQIIFRNFIGKILIILGISLGAVIVWDFFSNDYDDSFREYINKYIKLILE